MDILSATYTIFKEDYLRESPEFIEIIGVKDSCNYNNELATLYSKINNNTIIFTEDINVSSNDNFMEIYSALLQCQNLEDCIASMKLKLSLLYPTLPHSIKYLYENLDDRIYIGNQSKIMCITRCILWLEQNISVESISNNYSKVIYFGDISQEVYYTLQVLYLCGFDILYLNPAEDKCLVSIVDTNKQVYLTEYSSLSFKERVRMGKVLDIVVSDNSLISKSVGDELYANTGMYSKWEFRDGYTSTTLLQGIVEDIKSYYKEPPKHRPGFKVTGATVTVPTLFKVIGGTYSDLQEYKDLIDYCRVDNCLFVTNEFITSMSINNEAVRKIQDCVNKDYSINIDRMKYYGEYYIDRYSSDIQRLLVRKLVDFGNGSVIKSKMSVTDYSAIIYLVFRLNPTIINLINDFDFPNNNPKITMIIGYTDSISSGTKILLGFLHSIGFDILIFNPSGTVVITDVIDNNLVDVDMIGNTRIDINYYNLEESISIPSTNKNKGIISSFLGMFK